MIIIGIDGAISTTGICIYDTTTKEVLKYSKIETRYGEVKDYKEDDKIIFICEAILAECKLWNVEKAILEAQFLGKNPKTSMQLSRFRGALTYAMHTANIFIEYMHTSTINKTLHEININKIEHDDKKYITYLYIKSIYKNNPKIDSIGEFNNKSNKTKNSDIYDAIAIATSYGYING